MKKMATASWHMYSKEYLVAEMVRVAMPVEKVPQRPLRGCATNKINKIAPASTVAGDGVWFPTGFE